MEESNPAPYIVKNSILDVGRNHLSHPPTEQLSKEYMLAQRSGPACFSSERLSKKNK